ncbi:hypothetical protein CCAX7_39560 [Capsulimonas corticalis]|uniref:Uncharacterized protein n=1 Tax=Capsulimonas corticalis TaxID=2219043 RepID=A0A402D3P5_9BACT|nr:hypothetical protein [Capsulimonas corticalis]BDI31905.1 hypothetical protein CCAX7_39560 [Capsulimonas corticalis]
MKAPLYLGALAHFEKQTLVTIASGVTCAYLGDERNLREFLVADETAKTLQEAGHTVFTLLVDDSLDPLNYRQLRVAVNKDPRLMARCEHWCGTPIAHLPDPFECHASFAEHYEHVLLDRLHRLDCHPTLVSTSKLYERGLYDPYVKLVLERREEILSFLADRFPNYHPEKLFHPICPDCGVIVDTQIARVSATDYQVSCERCSAQRVLPLEQVKGKLNWKLDCAARWAHFHIDAEPFSKAYLEPIAGSFAVASALSLEFFGGKPVLPLHFGTVQQDRDTSYLLAESFPTSALRSLFVEKPSSDLHISRELILTTASRYEVMPGLTLQDFTKQLLPVWLLTPETLDPAQRELVSRGMAFSRNFLDVEVKLHLPTRERIQGEHPFVLSAVRHLIASVVEMREAEDLSIDVFQRTLKNVISGLGHEKKVVLTGLRGIVGQDHGLPVSKFLYTLPVDYLRMLQYILDLHLESAGVLPISGAASFESQLAAA